MGKRALLVGATGLIGKQLLDLLLGDSNYDRVRVVTRAPLSVTHAKLEVAILNFDELDGQSDFFDVEEVFCCLGTTIRKAKTQEAFRKVDYEYPLQIARLAHQQGASQFLVVSALGANAKSSIFYNRVKGELEDALSHVGYKSLHIFRPSLLLGPRTEARSGEDAAKIFYHVFGFLFPAKYKAIDSAKVARAMAAFAKMDEPGIFFHESAELQKF
jgi:uncharacterized protein YbjT (DUF2867 family)